MEARTEQDVLDAMQFAERQCLPRLFVGRGSNMLFSDTGYAGVVIVNRLRAWTITRTVPTGVASLLLDPLPSHNSYQRGMRAGDRLLSGGVADKHASVAANLASFVAKHGAYVSYVLRADSGCPADYLASVTSQAGLGGLEFAVGIPGTIGGLVAMNAGAHGQVRADSSAARAASQAPPLTMPTHAQEMADVVESVGCVDGRTRRWLHNDSLDWGYRTSCFASDTGLCVTSASIRLRHDSGAADKARDNLARCASVMRAHLPAPALKSRHRTAQATSKPAVRYALSWLCLSKPTGQQERGPAD